MSDSRAIEAVTETLRNIVDAGVKTVAPGGRALTLPPDDVKPSQDERVNLFLYQLQIDAALRNTDPTNVAPGETGQPGLPLILQYLLTPYASDDDDVKAHRLLGASSRALPRAGLGGGSRGECAVQRRRPAGGVGAGQLAAAR